MKNLPTNFKNFFRIVWTSFEEILEKVLGNFNEILQTGYPPLRARLSDRMYY